MAMAFGLASNEVHCLVPVNGQRCGAILVTLPAAWISASLATGVFYGSVNQVLEFWSNVMLGL